MCWQTKVWTYNYVRHVYCEVSPGQQFINHWRCRPKLPKLQVNWTNWSFHVIKFMKIHWNSVHTKWLNLREDIKLKKQSKKKTDVPKNEQMKTLALTMEDIKAANNIGNTIFSKVMVRVESAPRRFNLLKNIVEAKGILINPKVRTQIFNASRSTFHADQARFLRAWIIITGVL